MNSSSFLDYVNDNITSGQINSTAGTHQFPESRNSSDNFTSNQHSDSDVLSNTDAKTYTEQDWRAHPGDFKLIAFTFDDAPSYSGTRNNTTAMIDTMNKYNGSGTLFILGNNITEHGVALLEYAVKKDLNWEIIHIHTEVLARMILAKSGLRRSITKILSDAKIWFMRCLEFK